MELTNVGYLFIYFLLRKIKANVGFELKQPEGKEGEFEILILKIFKVNFLFLLIYSPQLKKYSNK